MSIPQTVFNGFSGVKKQSISINKILYSVSQIKLSTFEPLIFKNTQNTSINICIGKYYIIVKLAGKVKLISKYKHMRLIMISL